MVVRGRGDVLPTLAAEQLAARSRFGLDEAIAVALRRHRRDKRMSQRTAAEAHGWSKSHQGRLESEPGTLRLCQVSEALSKAGCRLAVLDPDGVEIDARSVPLDELLARDRAARRFPATRPVYRVSRPPSWWAFRYASHPVWRPRWTTVTRRSVL